MQLITPTGTVHVRKRYDDAFTGTAVRSGSRALEMINSTNMPRRWMTLWRAYATNPWLFSAIDTVVRGTSRIEIKVHRPDEDGNSEPIPVNTKPTPGQPSSEQRLVDLMVEPCPGMTWMQWARSMGEEHKVYGNALAQIVAPGLGQLPTELRPIPWAWVTMRMFNGIVLSYEVAYPEDTEITVLSPREVVHWGRGRDAKGNYGPGLSRIEGMESTLRLYDAIARHLEAYFKNSARLSGQLKLPGVSANSARGAGETLKAQAEHVQEMVSQFYSGPENAGKILVTSADWQPFSADPKSSSIVELKKLAREEIVAVWHVPPPLVGILDGAIKSNVEGLRSQYLRDVVGPDVQELVAELQVQLVRRFPQWRGLFLRPDLDAPLRPDLEARSSVYEKMRHVWTINEMRQFEGKKPLKGVTGQYSDVPWMPSGQVPVGLVQPQTQSVTYGQLPTDADGVGNLEPQAAPAVEAPSPSADTQKGGTGAEAQSPPASG